MLATLLSRLGQMAFVMFGISVLVFLIFFATPGSDPAARIAGITPADVALLGVALRRHRRPEGLLREPQDDGAQQSASGAGHPSLTATA